MVPSDTGKMTPGHYFLSSHQVNEMKDMKVEARRDIDDEGIEKIPDGIKAGAAGPDKDARDDGKTIDKEAKRVRRDLI
jgi:hypothetical protein